MSGRPVYVLAIGHDLNAKDAERIQYAVMKALRLGEVGARAEEIHAEHHPGHIVPDLDSCPEHTRAEYEQMIRDLDEKAAPA